MIFVIAAAIRLGFVFATRQYLDIQGAELERAARSLAEQHVFGNPFAIPTGPTAHPAPAYAILLAGVYALFGNTVAAEAVKQAFSSLAASLEYALLPAVAVSFGMRPCTGVAAGLIGALVPFRLLTETKGNVEAPYVALVLMAVCVMTFRVWRNAEFSFRDGAIYGALWGIALLFAPTFLPVMAGFLLAGLFLFNQEQRLPYMQWTVGGLTVAVLILLPWTVRNYIELGSPIWGRDNFGLEFDLSNYDGAGPRMDENKDSGHHALSHPLYSVAESEKIKRIGEVQYNRQRLARALEWTGAHRLEFARLTAMRALYFWFPKSRPRIKDPLVWGITVLGFVGLWRIRRRYFKLALLIGVVWLTFPCVYYLIQSYPRYRYPIDWMLLLLAVFGVGGSLGAEVSSEEALGQAPHYRRLIKGRRGFEDGLEAARHCLPGETGSHGLPRILRNSRACSGIVEQFEALRGEIIRVIRNADIFRRVDDKTFRPDGR